MKFSICIKGLFLVTLFCQKGNPANAISLVILHRYAALKKWKFEALSISKSDSGGFKVHIVTPSALTALDKDQQLRLVFGQASYPVQANVRDAQQAREL